MSTAESMDAINTAMAVTASAPGAVAIIQLAGDDVRSVLATLTGQSDWPAARLRVARFADIDEGLAVARGNDWAQVMPHGGLRVVQRLMQWLVEHSVRVADEFDARALYPEASCSLEASSLLAISRAASPAAVDLLLRQCDVWRTWLSTVSHAPSNDLATACERVLERSKVLDRLAVPPVIAVVGQPNIGKSTLTNRLLGRAASIVADLPGTTRDWVGGLAEIGATAGNPHRALAVHWIDTPGLRESDDAIEQQAITLSRQVAREASVVVAMCDDVSDWPHAESLPREPDLWVRNKADRLQTWPNGDGLNEGSPLAVSAATGRGIDVLERAVLAALGLEDVVARAEPWAFDGSLRAALHARDIGAIRDLLTPST